MKSHGGCRDVVDEFRRIAQKRPVTSPFGSGNLRGNVHRLGPVSDVPVGGGGDQLVSSRGPVQVGDGRGVASERVDQVQASALAVRPHELHLSRVAAQRQGFLAAVSRPPRHGDPRPARREDEVRVRRVELRGERPGRRVRRRRHRGRGCGRPPGSGRGVVAVAVEPGDDAGYPANRDGARIVHVHVVVVVVRAAAESGGDHRRGAHQVGIHRWRMPLGPAILRRGRRFVRPPPRVPFRHERGAEGGVVHADAAVRAPVRARAEAVLQQHRRAHTLRVHPLCRHLRRSPRDRQKVSKR